AAAAQDPDAADRAGDEQAGTRPSGAAGKAPAAGRTGALAGVMPDEARGAPRRRLTTAPAWRVRELRVVLDRPIIMGVLNITPDSFSDGGDFFSPQRALGGAERLLDEGADVLDIGGESTRPRAEPVSEAEELRRVIPVVRALRARFPDALLSVDTVKSAVARAALEEGAHIINDVSATRLDERMAGVCAAAGAGLILMHSRGAVRDMASYRHAEYGSDVAGEIAAELSERVEAVTRDGVEAASIVLDPGL